MEDVKETPPSPMNLSEEDHQEIASSPMQNSSHSDMMLDENFSNGDNQKTVGFHQPGSIATSQSDMILDGNPSTYHNQKVLGHHPPGIIAAYPAEPLTPETPSQDHHYIKHGGDHLPTPPSSDKSQRSRFQMDLFNPGQRPTFDIFAALMKNEDLILPFACQLDIDSFVSLYAISRDFHDHVNTRFTSTIMAHAEYNAPESAQVYPFKAYKALCRPDPGERAHPVKTDEIRFVPGFSWLRMILYREWIVDEIIEALAAESHRMPPGTSRAIKKLWLTMDVPLNRLRVGLLRNPHFWTEQDLCLVTLFFMKLDMRFIDPVDGRGQIQLRSLLMRQPTLTVLWRVLKGDINRRLQMMELHVRYSYTPSEQNRGMSILGVPPEEIGIGCYERAGDPDIRKRPLLQGPDDLIMREACRRGMGLDRLYLDMMTYGFFDLAEAMGEEAVALTTESNTDSDED